MIAFWTAARVRTLVGGASVYLAACSTETAPSPLPTAPSEPASSIQVRVFGRVLDYTTNAGVPGATIDFYISGLPAIASSVVTDASGRYSAMLSRGVRYNPRINGPDVDSNRGTIRPVAKHTEADYIINGGTCIVFHGSVRDATTGEPIEGATVRFLGVERRSAADGSYRLDLGCPTPANPWRGIGTVFMTVTREGYAAASPYGNRTEFLPSARTQRIDVTLEPSR